MRENIGKIGELYAEQFLISQNYQIIAKNHYCRFGEIDLITISPENVLVFFEVKTRTNATFGEPEEAINYHKKRKIRKTIQHFFQNSAPKLFSNPFITWRVDAISVKLKRNCHLHCITHLKNIFDG